MRTFVELVERYINPELCPYPEYKGKPLYSIKYIENGEEHVGYSSYSLQVISEFLKKYFISSALEKQEADRWHVITEEGNPPKMGYYLWSANGGAVEIDFFDGEKWEKASTYLYEVLAWKYRPKAYTEEEA